MPVAPATGAAVTPTIVPVVPAAVAPGIAPPHDVGCALRAVANADVVIGLSISHLLADSLHPGVEGGILRWRGRQIGSGCGLSRGCGDSTAKKQGLQMIGEFCFGDVVVAIHGLFSF